MMIFISISEFKKNWINHKKNSGFTLMEALIYIFVLAIVVLAFSAFLDWSIKSNIRTGAMKEVSDNARRVMEIMSYETKEAKSIYDPTSIFNSHPGQLSLKTTKNSPEGEETTYIDFYLCGSRLCFKKESQEPIFLTSDKVEINNLVFYQLVSGGVPSVQITLSVEHKNPSDRPEYRISIDLETAAVLRMY